MSTGYVTDAEYARIKASWRGAARNPERWTNQQMLEACYLNVREAAQREAKLRELDRNLPAGDSRRIGDKDNVPLALQIRTAVHDRKHWNAQLSYWRAECVEEGEDAIPGHPRPAPKPSRPTLAQAARDFLGVADRRLPPERDEEDDRP